MSYLSIKSRINIGAFARITGKYFMNGRNRADFKAFGLCGSKKIKKTWLDIILIFA